MKKKFKIWMYQEFPSYPESGDANLRCKPLNSNYLKNATTLYCSFRDMRIKQFKTRCIPVGCIPPAAVAVHVGGGVSIRPPRSRLPPDDPPEAGTSPGPDPRREQAPPCGQTHTCKHISLPQTSFAGIKYLDVHYRIQCQESEQLTGVSLLKFQQ